ncbi:DNA primase family protein [Ureibacillus chungkukjangi]|uniref:P4 family phage/plasmid primase-like protein n=1 Tax=Ureibacillus chungkukjangi TaxID=1202712 RepID=A0A318TT98_9BACL|nr:phage/plasmid primase, P4 family [Ureibacillus chungkukjangi]PYF07884.1 P4 family phage/plasmid primase-like protein [Ureibacillus chungkukjangi]
MDKKDIIEKNLRLVLEERGYYDVGKNTFEILLSYATGAITDEVFINSVGKEIEETDLEYISYLYFPERKKPATLEVNQANLDEKIKQNLKVKEQFMLETLKKQHNIDEQIALNIAKFFKKDGTPKFVETEYIYNRKGKVSEVNKTLNNNLFSKYLAEKYPLLDVSKIHYFYDNGVYKEKLYNEIRIIIREELETLGDTFVNTKVINDLQTLWLLNRKVATSPDDLNAQPVLINFKNGILNVATLELMPHSPEIKTTVQINANYNPNAEPVYFKDFFDFTFPKESLQRLVWQILGYSLSSYHNNKKRFIIFHGDKDRGKSLFLNVTLNALLPKSARTHRDLHSFTTDRFATADLYGKTVNINGELSADTIKNTDVLKILTGEDGINAQRKNGQPFEFVPTAKYLFAANTLPTISDQDTTSAFYERVIIIPFTQKVIYKDRSLGSNIIKHDLDYIATQAILALNYLINNNFEFDIPSEIQDIIHTYEEENNSVLNFVNTVCEVDPTAFMLVSDFMKIYKQYCEVELEQDPKIQKQVKKILQMQFGVNVNYRYKSIRGYMKGIKINIEELNKFQLTQNQRNNL